MFETAEIRRNRSGNVTYWKNGIMIGRKCTKCGKDKLIDEFRFNKRKGLYRGECEECEKEYDKKYYKNNLDKIREAQKDWAKNNPDRVKENKKKCRKKAQTNNLQKISDLLKQISPLFEQLNLPVYGYIYKIKNTKTNKVYIGQTVNPLKRRYRSNVIRGWINDRLKRDNQKFKEELIEKDMQLTEVLDVAFCQYHLDKLESHYINKYDSCNNGYNNNSGHHNTDDGLEEFQLFLEQYNLQFIDGKLIAI